jgi:ATP-dependent DNA ligase
MRPKVIPIKLAEVPRRLDSLGAALYLAAAMSLRPRARPAGFIAPCLPTSAAQPPSGDGWLHEIKHDGFRVIARKDGERVKLTAGRRGQNFAMQAGCRCVFPATSETGEDRMSDSLIDQR